MEAEEGADDAVTTLSSEMIGLGFNTGNGMTGLNTLVAEEDEEGAAAVAAAAVVVVMPSNDKEEEVEDAFFLCV